VRGDLADRLAESGAVVGGAAALGAAAFFVVGSIAHDAGLPVDPVKAVERGAEVGGALGLIALILRAADVH